MNPAQHLLEVENLKTWFTIRKGVLGRDVTTVKAVDDVSFAIEPSEIVGLVGESGSGKTTVGRTILQLIDPTAGRIIFKGKDLRKLNGPDMNAFRREAQLIFQDPYGSLNPRMRVRNIVGEPLEVHGMARNRRELTEQVAELLEMVGLAPDYMQRFPHEFSGGQRQRIGIARALAVKPAFIVADEPVSALDVSIQAQVINLLGELKKKFGLTLLFIAHDLALVEYVSDRIIVMYLGKIMEVAESRELCRNPKHPYTEALLSAVPVPDPTIKRQRIVLEGDVPSPINPPSGCVFRTRCPYVIPDCTDIVPPLREVAPNHFKACIRDDVL